MVHFLRPKKWDPNFQVYPNIPSNLRKDFRKFSPHLFPPNGPSRRNLLLDPLQNGLILTGDPHQLLGPKLEREMIRVILKSEVFFVCLVWFCFGFKRKIIQKMYMYIYIVMIYIK